MGFPTDPKPTQVKITSPTQPGPPNNSQWLIPDYQSGQPISIMGTSGSDVYAVFLYTSPSIGDPPPKVYCQPTSVEGEPGVSTWSGIAPPGVNNTGAPIVGTVSAQAVNMQGQTLSWTAVNYTLTP